jgi:hypothetical protein
MWRESGNPIETVHVCCRVWKDAARLHAVIGLAEFANATVGTGPLLEVEDRDVVVLSLFRHEVRATFRAYGGELIRDETGNVAESAKWHNYSFPLIWRSWVCGVAAASQSFAVLVDLVASALVARGNLNAGGNLLDGSAQPDPQRIGVRTTMPKHMRTDLDVGQRRGKYAHARQRC